VINENGKPRPTQVLPIHRGDPGIAQQRAQGKDAWIDICTEAGYTNLTSTTSVLTGIAKEIPFPGEKASEDYYAWLCYSASGAEFVFTPLTPTNYRIPQNTQGSASRSREGGKSKFYETKCRVDAAGLESHRIGPKAGRLGRNKANDIRAKFYVKEAVTMFRENEMGLAKMCIDNAVKRNAALANKLVAEKACPTSSSSISKKGC